MGRVRLLEEQDSRMKLLSWPCLLVSCLALTEALDFKHFPVVAGSPPSARTGGGEVSAQVRPPGNRESVQQVTSTTERIRVNRRRNKSRSRKISSAGQKTVAPVRAQTRTRTQVPRQQTQDSRRPIPAPRQQVQVSRQQIPASREQTPAPRRQIPAPRQQTQGARIETPTTRQRPTDFEAIVRGQTATKVMPVDFPVIPPVVQQSFDPVVASKIPQQRVPAPKLTPIVQSQQPSQTFSQSLIEFFQPSISPNRNQVTGEKQQGRFKEAIVQPSRQDVARFQERPSPLRVFTKNEPRAPQTQSFQQQSSQQTTPTRQPVQTQSFQIQPQQVSSQLQPERRKPIQRQQIQTQPIQQQQIQSNRASPVQAPKIQQHSVQQPLFQSINSQNIQLQPFQEDPFQGQAFHQTPTFKAQAQIPPFQAREPARRAQAPVFQAQAPALQARAPAFQAQQPPAFQAQGQALQTQAPTFQERPSLFSTPIDVPQSNGDGASFSFEAFVG